MDSHTETSFSDNPELYLAREFVEHTGHHVFLTGKAGTGKTTFLKNIRKTAAKRMIVTAPTGVAAINAGGVTLHSFFQLPLGPNVPGMGFSGSGRNNLFRISRKKRQIIKNLDLLVIDEISMVRADVLDAVDTVLRHHRRSPLPFGGVQLLMIGDLHQLPPVAKREEWDLLKEYYNSVYFFSSQALRDLSLVTIELQKIYRQSDETFIRILNHVRDNRMDDHVIQELNQRFVEGFVPREDQGYITLTTHNKHAESLNEKRLDQLKGKAYHLQAEVSGEFPPQNFPTLETLTLKKGAQVMFLRNDMTADRRYFNGKIGQVIAVSNESIRIHCPDDMDDIELEPVVWESINYAVDEETKEIRETVIGTFTQFPLKLAWAITIHKSQGLTFDKAVIDAQSAFAHGQVYVALSRCKTLSGMVLRSPVPAHGIGTDPAILHFVDSARNNPPTESQLREAKHAYQQNLLLECFDFQDIAKRLNNLSWLFRDNQRVLTISGIPDFPGWLNRLASDLFGVSDKFKRQLQGHFHQSGLPDTDGFIQDRVTKASAWFQENMDTLLSKPLNQLAITTDNQDLGDRIDQTLTLLKQAIVVKQAGIVSCESGFSPSRYLRAKARADRETASGSSRSAKANVPEYKESDIENPEFFEELRAWRFDAAKDNGVAAYQILHHRVLIQIAVHLPDTPGALFAIKGLGKKTIEKYGDALLELVTAYRKRKGIETVTLPEPHTPPALTDDTRKSWEKTLDLFNQNLSVEEIGAERSLAPTTILSHLCQCVEKGKVSIGALLSEEKQALIEDAIHRLENPSAKAIKEDMGEDVTYDDIRLMMAYRKQKTNTAK